MKTIPLLLLLALACAGCKKDGTTQTAPAASGGEAAANPSKGAPGSDSPAPDSPASAGQATQSDKGDAAGKGDPAQPHGKGVSASGKAGKGLRPPPANVAEYNYIGGLGARTGPPSPPVGNWEKSSAADMSDWTEIPLNDESEKLGPTRFKTYMDAATDVAAVPHSGQVIYELARSNELPPLLERIARELEYTDLLRLTGAESTLGAFAAFREKIAGQIAALGPQYGEFVGGTGRKDKVLGMLSETEMARLARWTFEYKDKSGQSRTGCYLFVLTAYNWMLLDMDCDSSPFK